MGISEKGILMLKHIETPYNDTYKYLFKHENGIPIGIYPMDAFDNGISFGYGHWAGYYEVMDGREDVELVKKYEVYDKLHTGGNPNNLKPIALTETYMTLEEADELLGSDADSAAKRLNKFLYENNDITVSQHEYDALIMHMHVSYSLTSEMKTLLKNGNRDAELWESAFKVEGDSSFADGWGSRNNREYELFINGNYSYIEEEVFR